MRVYAESNFVLEVVLEQEQHRACEELLGLAEGRAIELVLPAYALLEPHETIVRREMEGKELRRALELRRTQIQRTASLVAEAQLLQAASDLLLRAAQEATKRFLDVRTRILDASRLIAIDGAALREASVLAVTFALELPDAVVLASVLTDATERPASSIFLNRNTKDFDDPNLRASLRRVDCALIGSFDGGLARVKNTLAKT